MKHSEFMQLSMGTQNLISYQCPDPIVDLHSKHMWTCIQAHNGKRSAQEYMGHRYRLGTEGFPRDHVKAYVWLTLSGSGTGKNWVASRLSEIQLAEAERLVTKWKPNPAECEKIGAQTEN